MKSRPVTLVMEYAAHGDPVREHGRGSLTGDSEGKIERDILSER
jgi:hypothetical protein